MSDANAHHDGSTDDATGEVEIPLLSPTTPAVTTSASRPDMSVSAADFPRFVPRAPWWGGDLQTLRSSLIRERDSVSGYRSQRLCLSLRDGSGDRLAAIVNVPNSTLRQRPLVMLVHGVTGSELSPYVTSTAAYCLALGFPVVRLNLRGAGPSRPLCRLQYHAGQTDDLRDAIASLPTELTSGGIVAVGYSRYQLHLISWQRQSARS
jgi:uncharacterized protein